MTVYRIGKQKPALTTQKPWDAIDVATDDSSDVQTKLDELALQFNQVRGNPFKYFQRLRVGNGLNQLPTGNQTLNAANSHKLTHVLVSEQNTIGGIVHDVPFFSDYYGEFKANSTVAVTLRLTVRFYHFSNLANEFVNIQQFERRFSSARQTTVSLTDLSSPPVQVPLGALTIPDGGPTFNVTEEFLDTPFPFRIELDIEAFDTTTGETGTDTVLSDLELVDASVVFWQLNRLALGQESAGGGLSPSEELHFVSASFNNTTRTLTFTRANGSTLGVVIPESTSGFLQPVLTEFSLPGQASRIDTTDDLIGNLNYEFHISNSADLDSLTMLANSVNIGSITTFTPDGVITGTINISSGEWTSIIAANSAQVEFQLSGTDKDTPAGTVVSNTVIVLIQDVPAGEFFYYGVSTSNNPASVDVSTLNSLTAATGTFTLNPIDPAAGDYIIFLAPQDHDLTVLTNLGTNVNELAAYTETQSVRTIGGQLYDSYVLGPTRDTAPVSYSVTLA